MPNLLQRPASVLLCFLSNAHSECLADKHINKKQISHNPIETLEKKLMLSQTLSERKFSLWVPNQILLHKGKRFRPSFKLMKGNAVRTKKWK